MITVKLENFQIYKTKNNDKNILIYPKVFEKSVVDKIIENILFENSEIAIKSLTVGLYHLIGRIYRPKKEENSTACLLLENGSIKLKEKVINCEKGTVIIIGKKLNNENYELPKACIKLYEINKPKSLNLILKTLVERLNYAETIKEKLSYIKCLPEWKQCPQKYLALNDIGNGCYANICKTEVDYNPIAIKITKLKPEATKQAYANDCSSWNEVYILKEIIRPILEKKICPNLPLIYETFSCSNCNLTFENCKTQFPCCIMALELASENLKGFLSKTRKIAEIHSALFQIMSGLHSLQLYGQVMNYDIKKENILVYNIKPGGYWLYKIHGKQFFVPNIGKLFVINDFGLSRPMSPSYPIYKNIADTTFRLGSRYAVVKNGIFIPFNTMNQINSEEVEEKPNTIKWSDGKTSFGAEFRLKRKTETVIPLKVEDIIIKKYIKQNNNPALKSFFENPEVVPPFEFYNDTQDVIRMFIGGKRTTQKGDHRLYETIPKTIVKQLQPYVGKSNCMKDGFFSTDASQVLAGWFIEKFFEFYTKKQDEIIETFSIS